MESMIEPTTGDDAGIQVERRINLVEHADDTLLVVDDDEQPVYVILPLDDTGGVLVLSSADEYAEDGVEFDSRSAGLAHVLQAEGLIERQLCH